MGLWWHCHREGGVCPGLASGSGWPGAAGTASGRKVVPEVGIPPASPTPPRSGQEVMVSTLDGLHLARDSLSKIAD